MRLPSFQALEEFRQMGWKRAYCGTSSVHPKPHYYKFYWWIFSKYSPVEGRNFLDKKYRLSTAEAMRFMDELAKEKEPCMVYNVRLPRLDSKNPFNPNSSRWEGYEWAPSWDEDTDEEWNGFK